MDWSSLPSLAALRAFEAAARHQNLSAAARELNVTHAAIAQHVRSLEADLSTPLLFRSGRGVALTEEGRHLAQHLSDGFEVIAEGVSALQRSKEDRPLSVSVTPSFAANWLMPRIGGFWQAHPEISLSINPSVSLIDLRRDGFDMAIRFGNGQWPGVACELLTSGEFWVVASPKLLSTSKTITLAEAGNYPWLMDLHMLEWRQVVEDAGLDLNSVDMTSLETNELVLSATVAGLGVSVHPKSLVEREVAFGTLKQICSLPRTDLGYHLVTLPRPLSAKERAFRKWLMAEAKA
ncbi:LysR family transcriptional regulator [Shimia sp.]|jgi:LysR family glycine cleavage system transcriptional activator|uniref:LysR family transcriptional regulator n=1 Tax=unclassified Shimia TaxID=2630038 RepID=UPI0025D1A670|nr:LysR family transcriptional regulator [Shimia sp.]MCH2068900.1 LysR family transcriptional regulator [Shimia sp.]